MKTARQTAPADDSVVIPAAVRAAAEAAARAHQEMYAPPANDDPPGEPPPAEELTPRGNDELRIDPTPPVTEPVRTEPKPEPRTDLNDESWEHRYRSMKGRYDRAAEQISALSEQVSGLQRVIATMQAKAPATPASEMRFERLITPEEEQDYGSDFLNVVAKKAREEILPEITKRDQVIEQLKAQLGGVGNMMEASSREQMLADLDRSVPAWREQNVNPEFLSWLSLPDPYSGVIRQELLKEAYDRHDARRVASFFKGFLAEEAALDPASSGRQPAPMAGKVPLETLAAPGRAKTAAANSAPAEKPTFTPSQITQFYLDVSNGKYAGREEEKMRIERQIFDAQKEGRIR